MSWFPVICSMGEEGSCQIEGPFLGQRYRNSWTLTEPCLLRTLDYLISLFSKVTVTKCGGVWDMKPGRLGFRILLCSVFLLQVTQILFVFFFFYKFLFSLVELQFLHLHNGANTVYFTDLLGINENLCK